MTIGAREADMMGTAPGAWAAYQWGLKQGLSSDEAIRQAEEFTENTQSSASITSLTELQKGGTFWQMITLFYNEPNKLFRTFADAARNLKAGRGDPWKHLSNMVYSWVIAQALFQFVTDAFRWNKDRQAPNLLLGPFAGLLGAGPILKNIANAALGMWRTGESVSPVESTIMRATGKAAKTTGKIVGGLVSNEDLTAEDYIDAMEALAEGAGYALGLPLPYAVQVEQAIREKRPSKLVFGDYALKRPKERVTVGFQE
jgi:hypothetical protein